MERIIFGSCIAAAIAFYAGHSIGEDRMFWKMFTDSVNREIRNTPRDLDGRAIPYLRPGD